MNEVEIQRLAGAMNQHRPEWKTASLQTFLKNNFRDRAYRDVSVAAAWICTDEETRTPELLKQPGPWWQVGPAKSAQLVPRVGPEVGAERCRYAGHEHEQADRCRLCAAERAAGDVPEDAAPAAPPPSAIVEVANRYRAKVGPTGAPERRSFVQDQDLRQAEPQNVARCAHRACGGAFVDDPDGAAAHRTVFGHIPERATGPASGGDR